MLIGEPQPSLWEKVQEVVDLRKELDFKMRAETAQDPINKAWENERDVIYDHLQKDWLADMNTKFNNAGALLLIVYCCFYCASGESVVPCLGTNTLGQCDKDYHIMML